MRHTIALSFAAFVFVLSGCGAPTAIPTSIPTSTPLPTLTPEPAALPLSELGAYHTGWRRLIVFEDPSRNGRKVTITIWYPAALASASTASEPVADASPDLSAAPYPLIVSSTKVGMYFAPHLASHGFVIVGVNGQDSKDHWGQWLTDYPLDLVFALNQVGLSARRYSMR